ncbi:DUF4142 domain-containing protein [Flavobacterium aquicola]|uniref:Putative membrane protein n=1 Tax=Flavobacterium aquicola TaxID=1682742 RepID=A0A3E0ERK4_9FLAO|nr:DUF4142 domain-containing protein [Flavobacterium aquicola]REH00769.1 putative membrane protein [Flavobacterium aquicola]
MKKIINFSKVVLGAGMLLFTMNSCKQEPKREDPVEAAEEINDEKIENNEVKDDASFLTEATEINIKEIEIGKLAKQKAASTDIKKYAQMLIDDHTKALEELKAVANENTITLPAAISNEGKEDYDKLNEKSGVEFDKEFIDMMVDGHEKAVDKMTEISQKATNEDFKLWASRQTSTFLTHFEQAKKLKEKIK